MNRSRETLTLAQAGPTYGHIEAYENGRAIGRFTVWAMAAVIVIYRSATRFSNDSRLDVTAETGAEQKLRVTGKRDECRPNRGLENIAGTRPTGLHR